TVPPVRPCAATALALPSREMSSSTCERVHYTRTPPRLVPQERPPKRRSFLRPDGVALATSSLLPATCGTGDGRSSDEPTDGATETATGGWGEEAQTYSIGITQIDSHPSLDAARDGFKAALADAGLDVEYDEQNAQGDQTTAIS